MNQDRNDFGLPMLLQSAIRAVFEQHSHFCTMFDEIRNFPTRGVSLALFSRYGQRYNVEFKVLEIALFGQTILVYCQMKRLISCSSWCYPTGYLSPTIDQTARMSKCGWKRPIQRMQNMELNYGEAMIWAIVPRLLIRYSPNDYKKLEIPIHEFPAIVSWCSQFRDTQY